MLYQIFACMKYVTPVGITVNLIAQFPAILNQFHDGVLENLVFL
jgi:hypothetical protein